MLRYMEGEPMTRMVLFAACCVLCSVAAEEEVQIPPGVRYTKTSDEINERARKLISAAFTAKASEKDVFGLFSDKLLICGPGLWSEIRDENAFANIKTGAVNIQFPIGSGAARHVEMLEGKLFQNRKDVLAFWHVFAKKTDFEAIQIRKMTAAELSVYWAMISFDINEPIFMVECKQRRVVLQFTSPENLTITWIDDLASFLPKDKTGFAVSNISLYQQDAVLRQRVASVEKFSAFIKRIEAVCQTHFAGSSAPETLDVVIAMKPGGEFKVWFVSSTRANDDVQWEPLRKKIQELTAPDIKNGPVAFALSATIAGAKKNETDPKSFKPPMPKEWAEAAQKAKAPLEIPDDILDVVWPDKK